MRAERKISHSCFRCLRRGQVIVMVAVSLTALGGFMALAIDVGMLYETKAELQRTADAAALAAAWDLVLDDRRMIGDAGVSLAAVDSRARAVEVASLNTVLRSPLQVDPNDGNAANGDVVFGWLADPENHSTNLVPAVNTQTNAVQVVARRDNVRNGPVPLLFARIFGATASNVSARAVAAFESDIVGFRVTAETGNANLLPLSLQVDAWNDLVSGAVTVGDNYSYDPETGAVTPGPDGIEELNIYPGAGMGQLPPGNFGTVDIGAPNNSTADLARQILYGVTEEDLSYLGGELSLGPDGTIQLNGDTGLSAGIKDELAAIIGQGRTIPLFSTVTGHGNNAMYTIVKFGGIRIMHVKLTGPMNKKQVIIQPAIVVDDAAIPGSSGSGVGNSDFVYTPPRLVR